MQATQRGAHFFVRVSDLPDGHEVSQQAKLEITPGVEVDLRVGGKGYVVCEPSRHESGALYTWKRALPEDLAEIPELPARLRRNLPLRKKTNGAAGPEKPTEGAIPEGQRDTTLTSLAGTMRRRGMSREAIEAALQITNADRCRPPLDDGQVQKIARSVARYEPDPEDSRFDHVPGTGAGGDSALDDRPTIDLDHEVDGVLTACVSALVRNNAPPSLFLRGSQIVQPREMDLGSGLRVVSAAPLRDADVFDRLAEAARFVRGKKKAASLPSAQIVAGVRVRTIRKGALPVLSGVIGTPVMTLDGAISGEPGYHPGEEVWYAPVHGFELSDVPLHPTEPDREAAVKALLEVYRDFPFVDDADVATAIAHPFSIVFRALIDGPIPAFGFTATQRGTGKTLGVRAGTRLATGREANLRPVPESREEEWRKTVHTVQAEGMPDVLFDNATLPLRSGALCAALTSSTYRDRRLGTSDDIHVLSRMVWSFTGNNLQVKEDLQRRFVWCRLDAKVPDPSRRTGFAHEDLLAWVSAERPRLLAHVFTLGRVWIDAGRPGPSTNTPLKGGFEAWRHVIGGILYTAGIPGFLATNEKLAEEVDSEEAAWGDFLACLHDQQGGLGFRVRQVVEKLSGPGNRELADALPDPFDPEKVTARQLGNAFKVRKGIGISGWIFARSGK